MVMMEVRGLLMMLKMMKIEIMVVMVMTNIMVMISHDGYGLRW